MSSTKQKLIDDLDIPLDIFAILEEDEEQPANRRKTVRYVCHDLRAELVTEGWLGFTKKTCAVELSDLSSRGALIRCEETLRPDMQILLHLFFADGKHFVVPGQIVRSAEKKQTPFYGVRFKSYQHDLADYLLKTQTDVVFK